MTTNLALGMALALLLALPAAAQDAVPVPKLTARVIDQTATLSEPQRAGLEAKLEAFERERGSQVAVLLVPSTGSETIEEFAGRVADSWQLGRKGVDDGVLFVVAKEQRRLRIHTGRGVQGTLTDALSKRIVSDIVAPRFRANDFAAGIEAGVDAIMKAIEGEELPLPKRQPGAPAGAGSFSELLVFAFFLVPVAGMVLRSMFGRFFGAGITSGVTGVAAWVILGSLGIALVAAVFAFIFTLAGGSGLARGVGRRGGVYIPGGGWGGGGGGGWGGGGGFGGGGGGFDGGGASGSW